MHGMGEAHARDFVRAISYGSDLGHAERLSVGGEDGVWPADLVEQNENLSLRFQLLGNGFDHQVGLARGLLHSSGVFQALERCVSISPGHSSQPDRLIEVATDLAAGPAQARRQDVFEDGAVTAQACHVGDATAYVPGADDSHGLDLLHARIVGLSPRACVATVPDLTVTAI